MESQDFIKQFNNIMMHALDGIALIDNQGNYVSLNQSYANVCGYDMLELKGQNWKKTIHPDCHEQQNNAFNEMMESGKVELELKGIKKNGETYFKRLVIVACYNEEMIFQGHYCFAQDITARIKAEEELRRSQSLFESFMENNPAIAFMKDCDGKYIYANRRFAELVNLPREEVLGKTDNDMFPEKVAEELRRHDSDIIKSKTPFELYEDMPDSNGEMVNWLVFKFPFYCQKGDIFLAGLAIRNPVNELNEFKDALGCELQKFTISAINSFISGITHETRSPVQAIDNAADLLLEKANNNIQLTPRREIDLLNAIKQSANSIENIVSNIMSFGSIKGFSSDEDITTAILNDTKLVDLAGLIRETIRTFTLGTEYKENQIKIEYVGSENLKATVANNILRQVIINLLSNALKAISSYQDRAYIKSEGKIIIDVVEDYDSYLIRVIDNGRGIPGNLQHRLFNPFFRPFREIPGTGLGLYLSKLFASNAKMDLVLEVSKPGNTIFSISVNKD